MLTIRPATEADALSLAPRLRPADVRECLAAGASNATQALVESVRLSTHALAAVDEDDVPHILFGAAILPNAIACAVWMMGSEDIHRHRKQVVRETAYWLAKVTQRSRLATNYVHTANTVHIRWLRWAGFTFLRKVRVKATGEPFYEFAKITGE